MNGLQAGLIPLLSGTADESSLHESFEKAKDCPFVEFGVFGNSSQSQYLMRRRKCLQDGCSSYHRPDRIRPLFWLECSRVHSTGLHTAKSYSSGSEADNWPYIEGFS